MEHGSSIGERKTVRRATVIPRGKKSEVKEPSVFPLVKGD